MRRAGASSAPAMSNSLLDSANIFFVREMRFWIAASVLRNALAISFTPKPHKMLSTSATCASSVSRGWQQENIMRS